MRTGIAVAAVAASFALAFVVPAPVLAYQHSNTMSSNMTMAGNETGTMASGFMDRNMLMSWFNDTGKMFGLISSLQNDENGEPAWMTTGHWMMTNGTEANATKTARTNITDFYAGFQMIMLDGTAAHTHEIYNFTQDGESTTVGNATTVTGTSTVTMREGPVEDLGTEITISEGKVIAISLEPEALENHFGDTLIYGMVITPEIMQHIMNQTTMTSSLGNMTGMMGDKCDRMHGNTTTAMTGEMWK
ncbi:MAG TPA: hypothetical protein VD736_01950 [Nitrososphaera sp.]|nr:hypothetical protein [Nitrososphaera sp.]